MVVNYTRELEKGLALVCVLFLLTSQAVNLMYEVYFFLYIIVPSRHLDVFLISRARFEPTPCAKRSNNNAFPYILPLAVCCSQHCFTTSSTRRRNKTVNMQNTDRRTRQECCFNPSVSSLELTHGRPHHVNTNY